MMIFHFGNTSTCIVSIKGVFFSRNTVFEKHIIAYFRMKPGKKRRRKYMYMIYMKNILNSSFDDFLIKVVFPDRFFFTMSLHCRKGYVMMNFFLLCRDIAEKAMRWWMIRKSDRIGCVLKRFFCGIFELFQYLYCSVRLWLLLNSIYICTCIKELKLI